jgi:hypothetical protein
MIRVHLATLLWMFLLVSSTARASVLVEATVTPLVGSFLYEISIENATVEDLAIVSISDAPIGDPLIGPSLVVPVGFLASYDGGLGFVDFVADTSDFFAGTTTSGFRFESLSGPGIYFSTFEALSVNGNAYSGLISVRGEVPEPASLMIWAGLSLVAVGCLRGRRKRV